MCPHSGCCSAGRRYRYLFQSKGETPIPGRLHHHLQLFPSPSLPRGWDIPLASHKLCPMMSRAPVPKSWWGDISERLSKVSSDPKALKAPKPFGQPGYVALDPFVGVVPLWARHLSEDICLHPRDQVGQDWLWEEPISDHCSSWSPLPARAVSLWVLASPKPQRSWNGFNHVPEGFLVGGWSN